MSNNRKRRKRYERHEQVSTRQTHRIVYELLKTYNDFIVGTSEAARDEDEIRDILHTSANLSALTAAAHLHALQSMDAEDVQHITMVTEDGTYRVKMIVEVLEGEQG